MRTAEPIEQLIELTGTSKQSLEGAITNAIAKAAKLVHHMCWFKVIETRGDLQDGKVTLWRVTLKVGFEVDE
ncbi:MAG: dodecin domain-containing protein [Caldilineaceae bacterium]|nr:dodecin domain-containing protein [Caldilineaceae bacterium]